MLRRCLAIALAALVAGALAPVADAAKRKKSPRLHAFASCTNLLTYAKRNSVRVIRDTPLFRPPPGVPVPAPVPVDGGGGIGGGGGEGGGSPQPVAAPAPAPGRDDAGDTPTNVQEAGVDEPDWIKTSGSTVLVASDGRLRALDGGVSPPAPLGSIDLAGFSHELLVHGDRALVIASLDSSGPVGIASQVGIVPPKYWIGRTRLIEVDISDPRAMKVLRTYDVEGTYQSARLNGKTARVVIATEPRGIAMPDVASSAPVSQQRRRWRRSVRRTRTRAWLPAGVLRDRRTGSRKRRAAVRCRQVRRTQQFTGLGTLTVLTVDLAKGLPVIDADALMTSGETVYASPTRLYVGAERWLGAEPSRREVLDDAATGLHAFDITKPDETSYVGSGEVPGYLLNQWSLSEHEGVLRIATTSMPPWDSGEDSQSSVRTLEERNGRLVEIGRVGGLGKGEQIYAVRFMGDVGFVVTFRQVDPLYALDLADPRAPKVVGELKVPGYSAYLHPVGDGLLLGVGQDADEDGRTTGVQLSLFDISTLSNPTRLDQEALGGDSYTEVENDHHAFTFHTPGSLGVIPLVSFPRGLDVRPFMGAFAFRVDRATRQLEPVARIPSRDDAFARSLVLGGRLLLVSGFGILSTPVDNPGAGDFTAF